VAVRPAKDAVLKAQDLSIEEGLDVIIAQCGRPGGQRSIP
jgi:hypothetical protein